MIYAGEPRKNKDGTTSVSILSTITPSELREIGIMPGETELDQKEPSGVCVVCGGVLEEKIEFRERRMLLPPMIGPRNQPDLPPMTDGYFCTECGIRYEFVPDPHRRKCL